MIKISQRKLSKKEIFLFSTGNFGISIINSTILGFVLFFYLTEGLTGVSLHPAVIGALVGTALMVGSLEKMGTEKTICYCRNSSNDSSIYSIV
ncbi:MAG: hypothetical protein ACXACU_06665 [Candidatus Hodarchaeales archaeon]|jgi:Na+/melibiose symporter-like transporter